MAKDPTEALWERIQASGSECPLCRSPVQLDQDADGYRIGDHNFPAIVGTPSYRGTLHYPALRVGKTSFEVQCPMTGQPLRNPKP